MLLAAAERQKSDKRMINLNKYQKDLNQLGITNKEQQIEVLNSLLRFAIIAQNDYNRLNKTDSNEEE